MLNMQTRAMAEHNKGREAGVSSGQNEPHLSPKTLTKSGRSAVREEGECSTSPNASETIPASKKRKQVEDVFTLPKLPAKKRKKSSDLGSKQNKKPTPKPKVKPSTSKHTWSKLSSSKQKKPSQPSNSPQHLQESKRLDRDEKEQKFEQMYSWLQELKESERIRKDRERSRSHSVSRSRHSSRSSSRSHSHHSSRSRSSSRSRRHGRKEHEISPSNSEGSQKSHRSKHSSHKTSSQVSDKQVRGLPDFDMEQVRRDLGLLGSVASGPPQIDRVDLDPISQRLQDIAQEVAPKPLVGPPRSDRLGPVMTAFLTKVDFAKVMKVCEKYPRPENAPMLVIPELPEDADKMFDAKTVKNDERLKNDQKCTLAMFSGMAEVLDTMMVKKDKDPDLIKSADVLIDCLMMCGFVHNDFNTIRLKEVKQNINPTYLDLCAPKTDDRSKLLGKTSVAEHVKSCEELNKLKMKLKKPDPASTRKDFRKGGEYRRHQSMNRDGFRNKRRFNKRKRYYSPRGSYRKTQQDNAQYHYNHNNRQGNQNQEDKKQTSRRN